MKGEGDGFTHGRLNSKRRDLSAMHQDKKAFKQYLKSTRSRVVDDSQWTEFKRAEKKYKAKFPPPSFDDVLDLTALVDGDSTTHKHRGRSDALPNRGVRSLKPNTRDFVRAGHSAFHTPTSPTFTLDSS